METHVSASPYLRTRQNKYELDKEFILTWKSIPALWDTKHQYYTNKHKRLEYLEQLLDIYKKIKPDATKGDVRKKMNILRTNYKRELNKVEESKKSGKAVYLPKVWYFPLMNFLVENKQTKMPPKQNVDSKEGANIAKKITRLYCELKDESDTNDDDDVMINEIKIEESISENYVNNPKKQKCHNHINVPSTSDTWQEQEVDYNAIAVIWAKKLRRLRTLQRLYAEKAINDILFEAELGNLTKFSVVINSPSSSKPQT